MCDKTCIFFFFPIINKYLCMAKRSLLSRCPSYITYFVSSIFLFEFVSFLCFLPSFLYLFLNEVNPFRGSCFSSFSFVLDPFTTVLAIYVAMCYNLVSLFIPETNPLYGSEPPFFYRNIFLIEMAAMTLVLAVTKARLSLCKVTMPYGEVEV